jgi:mono/diheme cytochrome c family protein
MRRIKIDRVGIGIAAFVCVVALAAPAALAIRSAQQQIPTPKGVPADANIANGQVIFNTYFCSACHRLKAGGPDAYGQLGVDLNKKPVPYATAQAVVINGLPAALPLYPTQMVGYRNVLTADQVRDVAGFVAKYAGHPKQTCSECESGTS